MKTTRYKVYNEKNNIVASYSKELDKIFGDGAALSYAKNNIHFFGGAIFEENSEKISKQIASHKLKNKI